MTAIPGWYADPSVSGLLRWWDGTGWTVHTAATPLAQPPVATWTGYQLPVGPQKPRRLRSGAVLAGVAITLIAITMVSAGLRRATGGTYSPDCGIVAPPGASADAVAYVEAAHAFYRDNAAFSRSQNERGQAQPTSSPTDYVTMSGAYARYALALDHIAFRASARAPAERVKAHLKEIADVLREMSTIPPAEQRAHDLRVRVNQLYDATDASVSLRAALGVPLVNTCKFWQA